MGHDNLVDALKALWESLQAADGDFCGEQREWHLPRLRKAAVILAQLHPHESLEALQLARSPYDMEADDGDEEGV